jgi:hypothetical protein
MLLQLILQLATLVSVVVSSFFVHTSRDKSIVVALAFITTALSGYLAYQDERYKKHLRGLIESQVTGRGAFGSECHERIWALAQTEGLYVSTEASLGAGNGL